ncbi:ferredoxin [Candidatus Fermentibacterales bacterium]|nr:ferredoxin [Candidatus Fermentibacterales bacterium]
MDVMIEYQLCLGCGMCAKVCPGGFGITEGRPFVLDPEAPCISDAAERCPSNAIRIEGSTKAPESAGLSRPVNQPGRGLGQGLGRGESRARGLGRGMGRGLGRGPRDGRGSGRGGGGRGR